MRPRQPSRLSLGASRCRREPRRAAPVVRAHAVAACGGCASSVDGHELTGRGRRALTRAFRSAAPPIGLVIRISGGLAGQVPAGTREGAGARQLIRWCGRPPHLPSRKRRSASAARSSPAVRNSSCRSPKTSSPNTGVVRQAGARGFDRSVHLQRDQRRPWRLRRTVGDWLLVNVAPVGHRWRSRGQELVFFAAADQKASRILSIKRRYTKIGWRRALAASCWQASTVGDAQTDKILVAA